MKKSLLATAAAVALLVGSGLASAQQQNDSLKQAPANKMAPAEKIAPAKGAEATVPQTKPQMTGQTAPNMTPNADKAKTNAQNTQTPASPATKNAASDSKTETTGQGAGAHAVAAGLSTEQRTKIGATFKQQNVAAAENVNFSISIGTHVPNTLHFYPLPTSVVDMYPSWRGYEFIRVGNDILVINPRTFEIVEVIRA